MLNFIIGFLVGSILILIFSLRYYMKINNLKLNYEWLFKALGIILLSLVILHLIYSVVGIATSNFYVKDNGNICRGFKYGWKICEGNINLK